ncbi:MAG TPA: cellulase family glycosylhydrolase [Actinoplanes sp.]
MNLMGKAGGRRRLRVSLALGTAAAAAAAAIIGVVTPSASAAVPAKDWLHVRGNQIVDEANNPVWLTGTNWFGFNATERVFHGLWSANITQVTKSMADRGINLVRVPISAQLLLEWKDGKAAVSSGVNTYANPELVGKTSLGVFDYFLQLCEQYGIKVLLDMHSAEADNSGHNWPVWNKGTITTDKFYEAWEYVATRYRDNDTLVAVDIKNEPHGAQNETLRAKWDNSTDADNWRYVAETASRKILAINPNLLVLVEGIQTSPKPGYNWTSPAQSPDLTSNFYNTWWGGDLRLAKDFPINLGTNQDQLVYSPHDYGPLVYEQPWFTGTFDKASLETGVWGPNWLYLHKENIAPLLIGEWGGRLGQDARQDRWMTALRDLIVENRLHQTFWVLNPNSGDTGGLLLDDWKTWDEQKYALLKPALWAYNNKFVSLDHQIPLGGAGSTTGISLGQRYGDTPGPGPSSSSPRPSSSSPRPSSAAPSSAAPSSAAPSSAAPSSPAPSTGGCTATVRAASTWAGGYQGEVTVTNTGTSTTRGWTVTVATAGGTQINNLWGGVQTGNTVTNASYNGALAPAAGTTLGFIASGQAGGVTVVSCSAS